MRFEPTLRSELLAGQVAIVTGAAQGIGRATAETLAANGARVCIADVDADRANEAVKAIGSAQATAFAGDLVVPGVPDQLVAHAVAAFGRLDIVVNNAGYHWDAQVHKMTDEQFQAMLDIHLVAPFRICRAAAPHLREPAKREKAEGIERFRKVVLVSSLAASFGNVGAANYSAAKAGVIGFVKSLANEWAPYKINVNAVAFGVIQTRFAQPQSMANVVRTGGREVQIGVPAETAARIGLAPAADDDALYAPRPFPVGFGRSGTVQEAADAIFWLCSPLANYVTGQVIAVGGGARGGLS